MRVQACGTNRGLVVIVVAVKHLLCNFAGFPRSGFGHASHNPNAGLHQARYGNSKCRRHCLRPCVTTADSALGRHALPIEVAGPQFPVGVAWPMRGWLLATSAGNSPGPRSKAQCKATRISRIDRELAGRTLSHIASPSVRAAWLALACGNGQDYLRSSVQGTPAHCFALECQAPELGSVTFHVHWVIVCIRYSCQRLDTGSAPGSRRTSGGAGPTMAAPRRFEVLGA